MYPYLCKMDLAWGPCIKRYISTDSWGAPFISTMRCLMGSYSFVSTNKNGFSFLKIGAPVNGTDKLVFTVPAFGDLSKMKIGQQILLIGTTVSSSIFEGLNASKGIDLNVSKSNVGGLVLDLDGEALGIALSGDPSFASIKDISDAYASIK